MPANPTDKFISAAAARELTAAHDGDVALLYIWQLYHTGGREQAARDLCMTLSQLDAAQEKLSRLGLSAGASPAVTPEENAAAVIAEPAEETVEYTAADVKKAADSDPAFSAIISKTTAVIGKQLTRHDFCRLLTIYNHLGLPADVIYVLLDFCAFASKGPAGAERRPTMYFIEKQAFAWARLGITTAEEAETYSEKQKSLIGKFGAVKKVLEIYDRSLTSSEKAAISSWIELGYGEDAIRIAYERTIEKTGKLAIPYMNSIIHSWHEKGLVTPQQIEKKDKAPGSRTGKGRQSHAFTPTEFD